MATHTVDAELSESPSLLMTLPVEVRLLIYKFALQYTVDFITSNTTYYRGPCIRFRGTLALLHTSKVIRAESSQEMSTLATAYKNNAQAVLDRLADRVIVSEKQYSEFRDTKTIVATLSMLELTVWRSRSGYKLHELEAMSFSDLLGFGSCFYHDGNEMAE